MFRLLLLLLSFTFVHAQVVIEKIAGGAPTARKFAWELGYHTAGTAWDTEGNAYFAADNRVWKLYPDSSIEAVAGTGQPSYGGDRGPALQARLADPRDVRRDSAGKLYFFDSANVRIRRVDPTGVITTVAGNGIPWAQGMSREGRADQISLIETATFVVAPNGVLYLPDVQSVARVDLAGNFKVFAGGGPYCGQVVCPITEGVPATQSYINVRDLAIHPATGDLHIFSPLSSVAARVVKVSPDGIVAGVSGSTTTFFGSIAVDKDGHVYIARFYPGPQGQTIEGGPNPVSVTNLSQLLNDARGRVVYVDGTRVHSAEDGSVLVTYPDSALPPSVDGTAALDARLGALRTIGVSHAGEIYFADAETCRVRKIDRDGRLRTVVGSGTCGAQLPDLPAIDSLAFDPQDRLWVRASNRTFTFVRDVFSGRDLFAEVPLPREVSLGTTIAFDNRGRLYTGDANSVVRQELDGSVGVVINGQTSLGTDALGYVYYGNPDGIFRFEEDGRGTKILSGVQSTGRFTVDRAGHAWRALIVQDDNTVRVFNSEALDSAVAPNGDLYAITANGILHSSGIAKREKPSTSGAGVANAASYAGGAVAPGELVTIFGTNFGVASLTTSQPVDNRLPLELAPVRVVFNGQPGAITAVTPTQINVFVPSSVAGQNNVNIVVQVDDAFSQPVTLPVVDTMFGLSTIDASGKGQGAILNSNGTVNSRTNPAARGSIIVLFGTGEGSVTPQAVDGALNITTPYPVAKSPLSVKIGGQTAEIVFQGGAPTLPIGVYQINARIPASTPAGDITVEVVARGGATSKPVTVAVQ